MKYRIIKHDQHNWAIQEFQEGGDTISRGRYAGQEKLEKWKAPALFYRTLEDAAIGLLNLAAGDVETITLLEAIKAAKLEVLAAVAVVKMGIEQPTPAA
jgi:hypothetical protein